MTTGPPSAARNIDPLSLLLNLEANVIVRDAGFARELTHALRDGAGRLARGRRSGRRQRAGGPVLRRGFVAWVAHWFLRMAGITGRY